MKAIITNTKGDYFYTKENILNVQYVNKNIILTYADGNSVQTLTYNSDEVIINIVKM